MSSFLGVEEEDYSGSISASMVIGVSQSRASALRIFRNLGTSNRMFGD